jgi:hypothetical protein
MLNEVCKRELEKISSVFFEEFQSGVKGVDGEITGIFLGWRTLQPLSHVTDIVFGISTARDSLSGEQNCSF